MSWVSRKRGSATSAGYEHRTHVWHSGTSTRLLSLSCSLLAHCSSILSTYCTVCHTMLPLLVVVVRNVQFAYHSSDYPVNPPRWLFIATDSLSSSMGTFALQLWSFAETIVFASSSTKYSEDEGALAQLSRMILASSQGMLLGRNGSFLTCYALWQMWIMSRRWDRISWTKLVRRWKCLQKVFPFEASRFRSLWSSAGGIVLFLRIMIDLVSKQEAWCSGAWEGCGSVPCDWFGSMYIIVTRHTFCPFHWDRE